MANPTYEMTGFTSDPEDPLGPVGLLVEQIVQEAAKGDAKLNIIELDDDTLEDGWTADEQAYDADILKIESENIDLTQDDAEEISRPFFGGESDANLRCQHYLRGTRNPCLCGHHEQESNYYLGDTKVRRNNVHGLKIELRVGRFIVDFIEIKEIWVHRITGSVLLRGFAYTRTRNLDGRLQAYKSEVCRLVEIDTNDERPVEEQSLIEVTLEDLDPRNRVLHFTNKSFPECRFDPDVYKTKEDREQLAPLTARWVHIMQYPDKRYRRAQRPIDGETLAHLREGDVLKARHRDKDSERLRRWRGDTAKGGSYVFQNIDDEVPPLDDKTLWLPKHSYNAADMFSGAGGYTAGAKRAGIKVMCALDHWARCNTTYKANHPEVDLKEQDIMTYCNDLTAPDNRFDLVHLSPPCQTWSPAHTCAGKNDSANVAALYACTDIIFKFRPRIVTFEQTFGIIQERHLPWFNALVQSLTRYGYSLMWKVIHLVEYGLPQTRKRLIMIGAAPGEELPPFPTPTHAADPSPYDGKTRQKRFVSAIKACWGLVDGLNMHDPSGVKQILRQPWDGNQPMNRTITTSGGQAYHWDGKRDLTLAEFARLQGFPEDYVFEAPCIKKQIGNAFPPTVVHAIMKQIVHSLQKVDGINSAPEEEDVIHIDDSEGDDDDDDDDGNKGEYRSGDMGAPSPKHEREPEPDYPDYPGYFEEINSGLSEEDAMRAAIEESRQMTAPHSEGVEPADNDLLATYSAPTDTSALIFQNMTPEERTSWALEFMRRANTSRGRSRSRSSRRRSSTGSSVVFMGQRQLPTIIEDDDENRAGEGSSDDVREGCVDAQQPPCSDRCGIEEAIGRGGSSPDRDNGQDAGELLYEDMNQYERDDGLRVLACAAPPSSPSPGSSHRPGLHIFGSIPSQYGWSPPHPQAQPSSSSQGASSSFIPVASRPFDASQWQDDVSEDDAFARAMEMSIKEAVHYPEHIEQDLRMGDEKAFVSDAGLDATELGGSGSGCGTFNPFGPQAAAPLQENSEEEAYVGKGKGKAVAKRSLGGACDYDAENVSPPKKGRIQE